MHLVGNRDEGIDEECAKAKAQTEVVDDVGKEHQDHRAASELEDDQQPQGPVHLRWKVIALLQKDHQAICLAKRQGDGKSSSPSSQPEPSIRAGSNRAHPCRDHMQQEHDQQGVDIGRDSHCHDAVLGERTARADRMEKVRVIYELKAGGDHILVHAHDDDLLESAPDEQAQPGDSHALPARQPQEPCQSWKAV